MTDLALHPLPPAFAATREALHRLAERVVAPARVAATGHEIALEPAPGGFGTPPFPAGGRVRVEGDALVVEQAGAAERRARLASLAQAAAFAGLDGVDDDMPLVVDRAAAAALAAFYAFSADVLRELRAEAPADAEPSEIHLWPEHFDIAFEQGSEAAGRRAGYGASPGDEHHPEPYLYVGPWVAPAPGPAWNATGFTGAELPYAQLLAAPDPRAVALAFLRGRRDLLLR
jgi:hypothetical protein